jgi:hypothetical protein
MLCKRWFHYFSNNWLYQVIKHSYPHSQSQGLCSKFIVPFYILMFFSGIPRIIYNICTGYPSVSKLTLKTVIISSGEPQYYHLEIQSLNAYMLLYNNSKNNFVLNWFRFKPTNHILTSFFLKNSKWPIRWQYKIM